MKHFFCFLSKGGLFILLLFSSLLFAQQTFAQDRVKGKIVDSHGLSLSGVNVTVKGTQVGTITDVDGNYSIPVPQGKKVLSFSFMGYHSKDITMKNQSVINVTLESDNVGLDEVVVVGYGVEKKANLSGAVSTASTKMLDGRPVTTVGKALEGVVGNLNITLADGQANTLTNYNIRGYTSINGGGPLIVIDGIPSDGATLDKINPSDIETISVLKDAASAAIYGSRAAFGVILVTTKSGKAGTMKVNYNNNFTFRTPTTKPQYVMDPYTVAKDLNTMAVLQFVPYSENALQYAKQRSADPSLPGIIQDPSSGKWVGMGSTNWIDEVYKNYGYSNRHDIDISGKTDRLAYYFSGNYYDEDGMLKYNNDIMERYNLRSRLDFKLTNWWTLSNNTSYERDSYGRPSALNANSFFYFVKELGALEVPRTPDGKWTSAGATSIGNLQDGGRYRSTNSVWQTQFTTKIDLLKDVLSAQADYSYVRTENYNGGYSLTVPYEVSPSDIENWGERSDAWRGTSIAQQSAIDAYLNFNKTWGKHYIGAMVGFNQENYRYDSFTANRYDLITGSIPSISLATGTMSMSEGITTWSLRSAFGRFNYIYNDKYILEFDGRYDGSSRFPSNDRFVFNPSGSAAWIISKENFFQPINNIVSFMKFRGSYGTLGNQSVGAYAYIPTMSSGTTSVILDGTQPKYVSNPGLVAGDLTWEKVTTTNLGLDLNFLSNRLTTSVDVYRRDTKGMLTKGQTLPSVLGASVPQENAANLRTKGWEVSVGWKDAFQLAGRPFNYGASVVLSDNKTHITKYSNPTGTLSDYYVGKEMGEIWGLTTAGFFTSTDDIKNSADQTQVASRPGVNPIQPGDLKFEDLSKDGKINKGQWTLADHGDYKVIGNTTPRYTYGVNLNAEWNGIDLSAFFQGVGKRDYYPTSGSNMDADFEFYSLYVTPWSQETVGFLNHWTPENPTAYFPRMKAQIADNSDCELGINQTRYLQDASYIRLKNLTVGYTLPKLLTQRISIDRVRVFFSGDNLFTKSGLVSFFKVDPEEVGGAGAGLNYSMQKSYSFGLNISF